MGADVMIGILQWDDGDQFWPTWSYYAVDDSGLTELASRWYAEKTGDGVQPTAEALFLADLKDSLREDTMKIDVAVAPDAGVDWNAAGFMAWPRNAGDGAPAVHLLAEKLDEDGGSLSFAWAEPKMDTLYDPECRSGNDYEGFPALVSVPASMSAVPRLFVAYSGSIEDLAFCPQNPDDPTPTDLTGVFGRFVALEQGELVGSYLEPVSGETGLYGNKDNSPSVVLSPPGRLNVVWNLTWGQTVGMNMRGAHGLLEPVEWTVNFSEPSGGKLFGDGKKDGTRDANPAFAVVVDSRIPIVYAWNPDAAAPHTIRLDIDQ